MNKAVVEPFTAFEASLPPALVRGVDHVGLTVNDLDHALDEIADVFDGGQCYLEGPIIEREPGWMMRKLGAREGDFTLRVAAASIRGLNVELFDYDPTSRIRIGGGSMRHEFLAFLLRTPDIQGFLDRLPGSADVSYPEGASSLEVLLSSGIRVIVQAADEEHLEPVFVLGTSHYKVLVPELCFRFGLRKQRSLATHLGEGMLLKGPAGPAVAVLHSPDRICQPMNSDTGGHHLALHADDVDASVATLVDSPYAVMGRPETITEGPIVGDRWVYVASPTGFQLELINMPDGMMPYEASAEFVRSPIQQGD